MSFFFLLIIHFRFYINKKIWAKYSQKIVHSPYEKHPVSSTVETFAALMRAGELRTDTVGKEAYICSDNKNASVFRNNTRACERVHGTPKQNRTEKLDHFGLDAGSLWRGWK